MQVAAILLAVALLSIDQSSAQLSEMNREEILCAHNHVRSLVSPSATDMRRLVSSITSSGYELNVCICVSVCICHVHRILG